MEDVLDVYKRPRDPDRPLVCLDEASRQLTRDMRTALPMKPGRVKRIDYEYQRNGTANLFMFPSVPMMMRQTPARSLPLGA